MNLVHYWLEAGLLDDIDRPIELGQYLKVHDPEKFARSYLSEARFRGAVGEQAREKLRTFRRRRWSTDRQCQGIGAIAKIA